METKVTQRGGNDEGFHELDVYRVLQAPLVEVD